MKLLFEGKRVLLIEKTGYGKSLCFQYLAWEGRRLTTYLKAHEKVQTINKKPIQFTLKQGGELTIFV